MRRAHDASTRKRHPRCSCGKAIYSSNTDAGRDRSRYDLARIYTCDYGRRHLTSSEDRPVKRGKNTVDYRRRHTVFATCPMRPRDTMGHLGDTCPHPVHWPDRDPDRPYFPDVTVPVTRYAASPAFVVRGLVASALTRDGDAPRAVVNTFRREFFAVEDDADDALAVIRRWVVVE